MLAAVRTSAYEVPANAPEGFKLLELNRRHKKARQAYAMRAFRTSSQALVTIDKEFWWAGVPVIHSLIV